MLSRDQHDQQNVIAEWQEEKRRVQDSENQGTEKSQVQEEGKESPHWTFSCTPAAMRFISLNDEESI